MCKITLTGIGHRVSVLTFFYEKNTHILVQKTFIIFMVFDKMFGKLKGFSQEHINQGT